MKAKRYIQVIINSSGMTKIIKISSTCFMNNDKRLSIPSSEKQIDFFIPDADPHGILKSYTQSNDYYILRDIIIGYVTDIYIYTLENDKDASFWYNRSMLDSFMEREKAFSMVISKGWDMLMLERSKNDKDAERNRENEWNLLTLVNSMEDWLKQHNEEK